MKTTRWYVCGVLGVCTLLTAFMTQPAQAADQKTYFKLDAGLSLVQDIKVKNGSLDDFNSIAPEYGVGVDKVKFKMDPGFRFDLVGGYNISEAFALELEAGVLFNAVDAIRVSGSVDGSSGSGEVDLDDLDLDMYLWQFPILINGVYTFQTGSKFKPFLGVGVGGIFTVMDGDETGSECDFTFAYQGMAGLNYELSEWVDLGLTYKFLGTLDQEFDDVETDPILSHSFLLSLTWRF